MAFENLWRFLSLMFISLTLVLSCGKQEDETNTEVETSVVDGISNGAEQPATEADSGSSEIAPVKVEKIDTPIGDPIDEDVPVLVPLPPVGNIASFAVTVPASAHNDSCLAIALTAKDAQGNTIRSDIARTFYVSDVSPTNDRDKCLRSWNGADGVVLPGDTVSSSQFWIKGTSDSVIRFKLGPFPADSTEVFVDY